MQVLRIMGLPDKVIAFDELPERFLEGLEMITAEGFPNFWKRWLGTKKREIKIPPERDAYTGQVRKFEPIIQEDNYFYLVDMSIRGNEDQWRKITEYVRNHVSSEFRLTDKLEDMAKPLAPDKVSGITLEPEDVVIIPLPKEKSIVSEDGKELSKSSVKVETNGLVMKCSHAGCVSEFSGKYAKNALRLHISKKHMEKKEKVTAST